MKVNITSKGLKRDKRPLPKGMVRPMCECGNPMVIVNKKGWAGPPVRRRITEPINTRLNRNWREVVFARADADDTEAVPSSRCTIFDCPQGGNPSIPYCNNGWVFVYWDIGNWYHRKWEENKITFHQIAAVHPDDVLCYDAEKQEMVE